MLSLKDFDFELPKELIALYPPRRRSDAKLLVLDRKTGELKHRIFRNIAEYFCKGDLLVLNNTKVFPARLYGKRPTGGKVQALLLKQIDSVSWEVLVRPSGRIKKGTRIVFGENGLRLRLEGVMLDEPNGETGIRKIRFEFHNFRQKLARVGRIPLPPYIDRPDEAIDRELYQTVFAEKEGAVASPTAGLHFDRELLDFLKEREVETAYITLHVSYGTFQPVQVEDISKHETYEEEYEIDSDATEKIKAALKDKRRIVACGTTVVRTLETVGQKLKPLRGKTRLFIYPPYDFKMVDVMITNFHVPKSSLLMLVSAFATRDAIFKAYREAIRRRYRFYSYGDAMLIL